jgi:hypothetical protein
MVTLEDILGQFINYIDQDSAIYTQIEDYLVAQFASNLEDDLSALTIDPNQLTIDLLPESDTPDTSEN